MSALDCGHEPISEPGSIGTGYGITDDGRKICYACATRLDTEAMRTVDQYTVYLSTDGRTVTNWPGGMLGRVTESHTSESARKTYVQVVDVHGAHWHGVGPAESGTYVRLRRSKKGN